MVLRFLIGYRLSRRVVIGWGDAARRRERERESESAKSRERCVARGERGRYIRLPVAEDGEIGVVERVEDAGAGVLHSLDDTDFTILRDW